MDAYRFLIIAGVIALALSIGMYIWYAYKCNLEQKVVSSLGNGLSEHTSDDPDVLLQEDDHNDDDDMYDSNADDDSDLDMGDF